MFKWFKYLRKLLDLKTFFLIKENAKDFKNFIDGHFNFYKCKVAYIGSIYQNVNLQINSLNSYIQCCSCYTILRNFTTKIYQKKL